MLIVPLGVGGAFTKYFHNNYVIEFNYKNLLIDAGTSLRYSLKEAGYSETDITDIIITHLHSDHVGGLEEFAQKCKWIYNHKPTLWIDSELLEDLRTYLSYGLTTGELELEDFFNVKDVGMINNFGQISFTFTDSYNKNTKEYEITLIKTDNLHTDMKSRAVHFKDSQTNKNFIFTSDIKHLEKSNIELFINKDTVAIFQDCSLKENPVHADINQILRYYKNYQDKLYLMHYEDDIDEKTKEFYENKYNVKFVDTQTKYAF